MRPGACGTVRYGTVRYGTVQTVRHGAVQYGTVRYSTVRRRGVEQCSEAVSPPYGDVPLLFW